MLDKEHILNKVSRYIRTYITLQLDEVCSVFYYLCPHSFIFIPPKSRGKKAKSEL